MSQPTSSNVSADGMTYHQHRSESSTPITSSFPVNPSDHGALYTRLRNQVEFYFSPQNLARDTYLRNMLTAQHQEVPSPPPLQLMTPVAVITNFPKVRDICSAFGSSLSDPPHVLLARACEGSDIVAVSPDGAWIGPASQQLPPLVAANPRMGTPTPQAPFQQSPYPPSSHQRMMMMPTGPMGDVPMPYMVPQPVVQNVPLSGGSVSPSSNSLDSMPSQAKETVIVVPDMPSECNPILLMTVFTTEKTRPSSVSADANTNTWYVSFNSEADAKAAIAASSEKSVGGVPIKAKLKTEPPSARASVASASVASLSSVSANQRQTQMPVPQMVQQPLQMPGGAMMYPPGAYPMPQPSQMPPFQHGMQPYPLGPHYNMPPMPIPGQPFPIYPQQMMQPMYPYYMPQHGQPPYPMNQPPMIGRYGPGVPPPPPRYPGPPYPYQHGPQHHHMGDGPGQYQGHPPRHYPGEERAHSGSFHEGGQKKSDQGGKKKKNRFQKRDSSGSLEGNSGQQPSNYTSRENTASPNNFGRGKGRQGDNFRRSTGSASPAFNRHQRGNSNKFSKGANQSNDNDRQNDNKEIFSATDFPGLSGDMKSENSQLSAGSGQKNDTKIFSGYADALLKKKDAELKTDKESNATKETDVSDIDSITRQTEAMEREILSDFHDLRIPGEEERSAANYGNDESHSSHVTTSTKPFDHLPILPGMSEIGQSLSLDSEPIHSSALHPPSNSEVAAHHESSGNADTQPQVFVAEPLPSPADTPSKNTVEDQPAPTGAWGSRRLFSDVIKEK